MLLTWGLIIGLLLLLGIIGTIYIKDADWKIATEIIGFGVGGLIALIIFTGVAISGVNYYKYEIIKPKEITKSNDAIFVQFDDFETQNYYLKSEYDKIDSTTIFLIKTPYNYYNFEINHKNILYFYDCKKTENLLNKKVYD